MGVEMKKIILVILSCSILLLSFGCEKKSSTKPIEKEASPNAVTENIDYNSNPRKALEQLGFWNKQFYKLELNPLYGYCYQHLFPIVDTSQEKDVIAFHVKQLDEEPMVIFVVDKIAYVDNQFQLSGKINDEKHNVFIKLENPNTLNITLQGYNIEESFDIKSGIAYSSFNNKDANPVFDIENYDTCEELDKKILLDISQRLTEDGTKEQHGFDVKTKQGYDCWGKWALSTDSTHIYYDINKQTKVFKDYGDNIMSGANVRESKIRDIVYKNGVFYFEFEGSEVNSELVGHMCLPIDDNSSMWVLDDINLGIFIRTK